MSARPTHCPNGCQGHQRKALSGAGFEAILWCISGRRYGKMGMPFGSLKQTRAHPAAKPGGLQLRRNGFAAARAEIGGPICAQ